MDLSDFYSQTSTIIKARVFNEERVYKLKPDTSVVHFVLFHNH